MSSCVNGSNRWTEFVLWWSYCLGTPLLPVVRNYVWHWNHWRQKSNCKSAWRTRILYKKSRQEAHMLTSSCDWEHVRIWASSGVVLAVSGQWGLNFGHISDDFCLYYQVVWTGRSWVLFAHLLYVCVCVWSDLPFYFGIVHQISLHYSESFISFKSVFIMYFCIG